MSSSSETKNRPKISVGLPVYNGEQFLRKRIDSVLAQTFSGFELIISDNASTDSTSIICEEYTKKDNRIRYVRQEKNIGMMPNFYFLLQEAKSDYFVWAAVDDLWHPKFLEKTVATLETNRNVIASIGKAETYGNIVDPFRKEKAFLKRIGIIFRPLKTTSIAGSYENRVRRWLKNPSWEMFYAVYRIEILRNSIISESFSGQDGAAILNALKYGNIHVVDEVLLYIYLGGTSSKGIFHTTRLFNKRFLGLIFPLLPFTVWCIKNLGIKIFLKNIDAFARLNFDAEFLLLVNLVLRFKKN